MALHLIVYLEIGSILFLSEVLKCQLTVMIGGGIPISKLKHLDLFIDA